MLSAHQATIIANTCDSIKERQVKGELAKIEKVIQEYARNGFHECLYERQEIWPTVYNDVIRELHMSGYRVEDVYNLKVRYIHIMWGGYDVE